MPTRVVACFQEGARASVRHIMNPRIHGGHGRVISYTEYVAGIQMGIYRPADSIYRQRNRVRTGHYWEDFASLIHISTNFLLEWKCDELHMMKINSSNARHDSNKEAKGDSILVIMGLSLLNTICLANTMSNASIYTQEEDKQF